MWKNVDTFVPVYYVLIYHNILYILIRCIRKRKSHLTPKKIRHGRRMKVIPKPTATSLIEPRKISRYFLMMWPVQKT